MKQNIKNLINKIKNCALKVYQKLGDGWGEEVYQKAMEVILREEGIDYEEQRVLPITFRGKVVGRGYPDLIVWFKKKTKESLLLLI
jgi:GxxExxY protein